jgi:hypothetical protein
MPEELIIALVVVFAIGWVLFKLASAFFNAISETQKGLAGEIARMRARRFEARRTKFAPLVRIALPDDLTTAEREIRRAEGELERRRTNTVWKPERPPWEKKAFLKQPFSPQRAFHSEMNIGEIDKILRPEAVPWSEKEAVILRQKCEYPHAAPVRTDQRFERFSWSPHLISEAVFEFDSRAIREKVVRRYFEVERTRVGEYNRRRLDILSRQASLINQIDKWNAEERTRWDQYADTNSRLFQEELAKYRQHSEQYAKDCIEQQHKFETVLEGFKNGAKEAVLERVEFVLGSLDLPGSVPRLWNTDYDEDQHILIVELGLPDVVHRPPAKFVQQKIGMVAKPLNQSERREFIPKVHPAILLRVGFEIARNNTGNTVKLLVLNGWVEFREPTTGLDTIAYTASLMAEPHQLVSLNLRDVDPVAAFNHLHGKSAGKLIEIVPVEPMLNLRRVDSRFVDAKALMAAPTLP